MTLNQNNLGGAQPARQEGGDAAVQEIYPGASVAPRVKVHPRRRLMGS